MSEKKYYLYVKRRKVEVSEELYKSYYVEVEKLKYEKKKERRYRVNSYHALDTNDQLGEEMLEDTGTEPIEEIVVRKILIEQLKKSLELLSDDEMELI